MPTTTGATTSSTATPVRTSSSAAPGSDRITGGSGDDDLIGGNTGDAFLGLSDSGGAGGSNAGVDYSAGLTYGDDWDATGGIDGPHSACNTDADCTYGDFLDGGSGNDVLAGDNATILRTGTDLGPRFRVLPGAQLMDPSRGWAQIVGWNFDGTTPCEWFDANGKYAGTCATYGYQQDPRGARQRFVRLYDQDATLPGTWSDSDLAGGAGDDVLFGQLGNDWIQGDSAVIDDLGQVLVDVQTRESVTDHRNSVQDRAGLGTDGDDYAEGNGGDDVIWGDLGQDDLVGGSSDMYSLVLASQRPNGIDTIYGGAGMRTVIDDPGDISSVGHAQDSDAILGDNGNLYRIVGAFGSSLRDATGEPAATFLAFAYDNYSTFERIVPRSWSVLTTPWNRCQFYPPWPG